MRVVFHAGACLYSLYYPWECKFTALDLGLLTFQCYRQVYRLWLVWTIRVLCSLIRIDCAFCVRGTLGRQCGVLSLHA